MEKEILISFCSKQNLLLDNFLLNLFLKYEIDEVSSFLIKLKTIFNKKFINLALINNNKEKIKKILEEISILKGDKQHPFIKELGLDLIIEEKEEKKEETGEIEASVKIIANTPCTPKALQVKDFITYFRNRYDSMKNYMQEKEELENLVSIGKISGDKQKFSVIGMVSSRRMSKNGNLMLEIEDLTGKMKVIINSSKEELFKEAEDITLDSVLGFKGVGSREIMFVNEVVFPDTFLDKRKKSNLDENVLFMGDFHYGSKNFLEKDFLGFIKHLNESEDLEIKKVKYLFIVGDLVTGVGNYPNQEPDLKVVDLEEQFQEFANHLSRLRKDIKIIISPGNHDGVRLMEPQPLLDEKYAWPLYELENVILTGNPSTINIGSNKDFEGFNVLIYHGFSYPYYANTIPKLMKEKTMNEPEKIMKYLLKNRHLAPTHSSTQYFPSEKDGLLIRKVPDIFLSGHTHKSGVTYYNNILIVSSSSWEGLTPYQEKFGNKPDHCKVPMLNLKTRAVKILDFETGQDGIKLNVEENE